MAPTNSAPNELLRATLRAARAASPYYRTTLSGLGDEPDWSAVPFTDSRQLLEERSRFQANAAVTMYASSGTTARAKMAYFTAADHDATVRRTVQSLVACGVRPGDT